MLPPYFLKLKKRKEKTYYFINYSLVIMSLLFFLHIFSILPIFDINKSDIDNISRLISEINRLAIFLFGSTITAHVYLQNVRNKISSSHLWNSKQLHLLRMSLILNLILLFGGTIIINSVHFFTVPSVADGFIKNISVFFLETYSEYYVFKWYLGLLTASIILYIITFIKFLEIFNTNLSIQKHTKNILKQIYVRNPYKIFRYENRQLKLAAHNDMTRLLENPDAKEKIIRKFWQSKINQCHLLKKFIFIWYYISYLFGKKIFHTHGISERRYEKLILEIEILYQQLEYLIAQNSKRSIDNYFNTWNSISDNYYVNIFQSNYDLIMIKNEPSIDIAKKFYEDILGFHAKLIISSSKNYEHSILKESLINSFLNALPHKPDSFYKKELTNEFTQIYVENVDSLKNSFFKEQLKLLIDLIKQNDYQVFYRLKELVNSDKNSLFNKYNEKNEVNIGYENLFISIVHRMIDIDETEHISLIISLIMNIPQDISNNEIEFDLPLTKISKNDKTISPSNNDRSNTLTLSENAAKGIYYAIIKANELEHYKASGYLVKILAANIKFDTFIEITKEIEEKNKSSNKNMQFKNSILTTHYNDISFQYCFGKTFVLIYCQYLFRCTNEQEKSHLKIVDHELKIPKRLHKHEEFKYFLKKIENKQKEYNMISLLNAESDYTKFVLENVYNHTTLDSKNELSIKKTITVLRKLFSNENKKSSD